MNIIVLDNLGIPYTIKKGRYKRITIADYIKIICDEYEYDCQC